MPTYTFACPASHRSELRFSMAEVPASVDCPQCSVRARRVLEMPHLHASGPAMGVLDATERSAHEPAVVRSVNPGSGAPVRLTSNPLHQKLPRP